MRSEMQPQCGPDLTGSVKVKLFRRRPDYKRRDALRRFAIFVSYGVPTPGAVEMYFKKIKVQ